MTHIPIILQDKDNHILPNFSGSTIDTTKHIAPLGWHKDFEGQGKYSNTICDGIDRIKY